MKFTDYIYEMAFRQKNALENVEALVPETIVHILKCRLMPDSVDIPHWLNEIKAFTKKMNVYSNTKTKSGKLSYANLIKQCEIEMSFSEVLKEIPDIEWEYNTRFSDTDAKEAINFAIEIMKCVFLDISQNNFRWLKIMQKITNQQITL